jgi:hypothetical protein
MNQYVQIIQLAKQCALKKFALLAQRMAQNSDQELAKALSANSARTDYATLNSARHFLRKAGDELLQNIETQYRLKLEKALQGMLSGAPVETGYFTAATLTLIDDNTINRHIEVGHLAGRLSASCSESLGRVNSIISQMLEKPEVREKDNPFRPDLIAHTLYEVLFGMVQDTNVRHFLLNYSSHSLAIYLSEYYVELCEVFKSGGISPKIYMRPTSGRRDMEQQKTRPTAEQRDSDKLADESDHKDLNGSTRYAAPFLKDTISRNALPSLQRILKRMQQQPGPFSQIQRANFPVESMDVGPLVAFQGFVHNLYSSSDQKASNPATASSHDGTRLISPAAPSAELVARLDELQKMVASEGDVAGRNASFDNPFLLISDNFDDKIATESERMVLDLIVVLFDLIGRDQQISEGLRDQIRRLQIPFLKSVVLDPCTLQQVDHPTRKLLDHMGTVSGGLPAENEFEQQVGSEIKRIVKTILTDFHKDTGIFATCLDELKKFVGGKLQRADAPTRRNIEALEQVQRISYLTHGIESSIRDLLLPLNLDQRVIDFCLRVWVQVLVKASVKITNMKSDAAKSTRARLLLYFNVLPELAWSAQQKTSTDDRVTLITLLPKLVKIIKSGLATLPLTEAESKQVLDQLLAVHAHALASTENSPTKNQLTLNELRQLFKLEAIQEEVTASKAIAPPPLDSAGIKAALAKKGIEAILHVSPVAGFASKIEREWLADMQVGTRIEFKDEGRYHIGRLVWMYKNRTIFMFRLDKSPRPLIYCPISLSTALRDGTIAFVESVPTFERAVNVFVKQAELLRKRTSP